MQSHKEAPITVVKKLLSKLNLRLRPFGFRRRGQSFAKQSSECWQVINVQLSRFSEQDEKRLTINFGVQSKCVLQFRGEEISTPPLHYSCPINFRIGWLMDGDDVWWTVRNDVSGQAAFTDIDDVLQNEALPFLDQLQTNKSILELYESGQVLGFEIDRDESRLLVLAKIGTNDEVQRRLEEYRVRWPGTGAMRRAADFLARFESIKS